VWERLLTDTNPWTEVRRGKRNGKEREPGKRRKIKGKSLTEARQGKAKEREREI
jgi:hypothetical protein